VRQLCEFRCNSRVELKRLLEFKWQINASFLKRGDDTLGGNVSNERILSERTAPQTTKSGIKSAAAAIISGMDFPDRVGWRAVQMHTDFTSACFQCEAYDPLD
jgi:hypothetical protein